MILPNSHYAFPKKVIDESGVLNCHTGITRREWFAGQALGNAKAAIGSTPAVAKAIAQSCYILADAMIAESARVRGE